MQLKELEVVAETEPMLTAKKYPSTTCDQKNQIEKRRRLSPIQALHSKEKEMKVTGPLPTFTTC